MCIRDRVKFIADEFGNQLQHYNKLNEKYDDAHKYPDQTMVRNAITATQEALNQKKDNIALIDYLLKKEDDLFDPVSYTHLPQKSGKNH